MSGVDDWGPEDPFEARVRDDLHAAVDHVQAPASLGEELGRRHRAADRRRRSMLTIAGAAAAAVLVVAVVAAGNQAPTEEDVATAPPSSIDTAVGPSFTTPGDVPPASVPGATISGATIPAGSGLAPVTGATATTAEVVSRFPDGTPETVRVGFVWEPPDGDSPVSGYRVTGTPLFGGTTQFGDGYQSDVGADVTSLEVDVTIGEQGGEGLGEGGYVLWEITAFYAEGVSPAARPSFVVPELVGGSIYDPYRILWSLGGTQAVSPAGDCGYEVVCDQDPEVGATLPSGGMVTFTTDDTP